MYNNSLHKQLATAHAQAARPLHTDMPAGMGVNRSSPQWRENWDRLFRASPHQVYDTLCRDIQGDAQIFVDLNARGEGEFSLTMHDRNRIVFEVENKISTDYRGTILIFKDWENKDIESRGQGTGLKLFRNFFTLAERGGIDFIKLRAGKEDGRYFWARHGFYAEEPRDIARVSPEILENIEKYSNTIPSGICDQARRIVGEGGLDMCWKLARLEGQVPFATATGVRVKPLGWALLRTDSEGNYNLDMRNAEQVARVKSSFERIVPSPVPQPSGPASGLAPR